MEIDLIRIICGKNINNRFFNACRDDVFRLRYDIYCKEMKVIGENREEKLYDDFDFSQNTVIFAAAVNEKIVGTIRLVKYSEKEGFSLLKDHSGIYKRLNKIIDFERKIYGGRSFSEASRFSMLRDYRRRNISDGKLISFMLMMDYITYCKDYGLTDIIGIANPNILNFYKKVGLNPLFTIRDELTGIESPVVHGEVDIVDKSIRMLNVKIKFLGIFNKFRRFMIQWIR